MGCEEGEIKVRSHPSAEERRKNSSLHDFDGPVSNLQGTNTKKDTEQCSRSTFSVLRQAAKFLDTLSKLPGMAEEASDSFSAYIQVKMTEASRLLQLPKEDCPEIGSRFSTRKRPQSWDNIEDTVVPS